jgi:hypothetical protein
MASANVYGRDGSCRDVIWFDEKTITPMQLYKIVNEEVIEGWERIYVHQFNLQPFVCFITRDKQFVHIETALNDSNAKAIFGEIVLKDYLAKRGR